MPTQWCQSSALGTLETVPVVWATRSVGHWYSSPSKPINMRRNESTWHPNARKAVSITAQICLTPSSHAVCHVEWLLWACSFESLVVCSLLNSVCWTLMLSFTLKHLQSVWSSLFFSITYSGHLHTLIYGSSHLWGACSRGDSTKCKWCSIINILDSEVPLCSNSRRWEKLTSSEFGGSETRPRTPFPTSNT